MEDPAQGRLIRQSPRRVQWWVGVSVVSLLAASVGAAPPAVATPADDSYLAQLRAVGLTWPVGADEALIGEAHLICYDLMWGWQPQQIADDINAHMNARGVTLLDIGTMVNAAHSTYCPGNVCDAPSLCTGDTTGYRSGAGPATEPPEEPRSHDAVHVSTDPALSGDER